MHNELGDLPLSKNVVHIDRACADKPKPEPEPIRGIIYSCPLFATQSQQAAAVHSQPNSSTSSNKRIGILYMSDMIDTRVLYPQTKDYYMKPNQDGIIVTFVNHFLLSRCYRGAGSDGGGLGNRRSLSSVDLHGVGLTGHLGGAHCTGCDWLLSSGRVSTGRHLVTRGGNRTGGRALLGRGGGPRLLLLLMLLRRLLGAGLASLVTRVLLASVGRVVLGATSDNTKDGRLPVVALANAVLDGKGSLGIRLMSLVVINVGDNGVFTVCEKM